MSVKLGKHTIEHGTIAPRNFRLQYPQVTLHWTATPENPWTEVPRTKVLQEGKAGSGFTLRRLTKEVNKLWQAPGDDYLRGMSYGLEINGDQVIVYVGDT